MSTGGAFFSSQVVILLFLQNSLLNNLPQAKRAAYNAKSRAGRRSCTAKTREKILADLVAWAADAGDTSIYWLNGMAGTGKTTIAYTFSQILDYIEVLGASFFCSHLDTDSSNADLIFPTLAYELARHSTAASNALLNALKKDRNVGHKSMRDQFLNLIVTPTKAASESASTPRPLIIVIDALDECTNQSDVSDVLTIIRKYSPILPLKFFMEQGHWRWRAEFSIFFSGTWASSRHIQDTSMDVFGNNVFVYTLHIS